MTESERTAGGLVPDPGLSPRQVVRFQLEALSRNDDPRPDAGIAAAFRFASEANRRATGPLSRFAAMLRNPLYRPMIDHARAQLGPVQVVGDVARVQVVLFGGDGRVAAYDFTLSKDGATGCWMTDAVTLAPAGLA